MRRFPKPEAVPSDKKWSLLTTHALVLLCIARNPDTRVREIAQAVGISERGAHQIVADLVDGGYVRRARVGRRNRYAIDERSAIKQAPIRHRKVASIIALLDPEPARVDRRKSQRRLATDGAATKPTRRRAA